MEDMLFGLAFVVVLFNALTLWAVSKAFSEINSDIDDIRDELRKNRGEK